MPHSVRDAGGRAARRLRADRTAGAPFQTASALYLHRSGRRQVARQQARTVEYVSGQRAGMENDVEANGQLVVDMHVHVGLVGDGTPRLGAMSLRMQRHPAFAIFLAFAGLRREELSDRTLREATERALASCPGVDRVVCLALDPVYAATGERNEEASHLWVDNAYVLALRDALPGRVLFGASVHPYDPAFARRVRECVEDGAVLLKWLPSAQGIDLAHPKVETALKVLATARPGGRPLPLLLHCGAEYAILPTEPRWRSADFLSFSRLERLANAVRPWGKLRRPDVPGIRRTLESGLAAGAAVIFAHCGLPYFATGPLGSVVEHSDFATIRDLVRGNPGGAGVAGCCFVDVSACCTPFRRRFFPEIAALPAQYVLYGSDFPTPVFELSGGVEAGQRRLRAALEGGIERLLVPEGNPVELALREMKAQFPGHPMFTNFNRLR